MPRRPKHLPADERRAVIIEAVVELAARLNPGNITTAAIAEHMGLTQGALFRHFPTKDAILQAVMAWTRERLLARLDEAAESGNSALARLEAMFMAHVDFVCRHPGVPRMIFGQLQRPGQTLPKKMVRSMMQGYSERLRGLLEAGRKQGEVSASLDVDAAIAMFVGIVQGLVMQSLLEGGPARMRREAPAVFAIYRRGIGSSA